MNRYFLLLLAFLASATICQGQTGEVPITTEKIFNEQYKDFVVDNDFIWALTTKNKIRIFNLANDDHKDTLSVNVSDIDVLTKDRKGIIVTGGNKAIRKYNKINRQWETIITYSDDLLGITFDSKNNYYLITSKGIYDPSVQKTYYPGSTLNPQIRLSAGWSRPSAYMTDKNDNIWIGFGYGEWGGQLFIFNTATKKFIIPDQGDFRLSLNPVKSIFEGVDKVYLTSGLMHMMITGEVVQFDHFKAKVIFNSEIFKQDPNDTSRYIYSGEYIGPGIFNPADQNIYFYSQHGIFKGNPATDLSKIENWTKVAAPKLHWSDGQPDAVGSPMNVLKMQYTGDGKLVFVSELDGIGIFDGRSILMLQ